MKYLVACSILVVGILVSCDYTRQPPVAWLRVSPRPTEVYVPPTPFPYTPVPLETLPPYPTPEDYDLFSSQFPVQDLPGGVTPPAEMTPSWRNDYLQRRDDYPYYLVRQRQIGVYAVREWAHCFWGWGIVTISTGSKVLVQLEAGQLHVPHAGRDLTGEGHPDVVVELLNYPASCIIMSTQVFDLGPELTKVMDTPWVVSDPTYRIPCPYAGIFSDLDADGSAEFLTCDNAPQRGHYGYWPRNPYFDYKNLLVLAILAYEPGLGYVPAGPRFASLYAPTIAEYTRRAQQKAALDSVDGWPAPPIVLVALAFNYLYSGQPEKAWAEIDRLHTGPDTVLLWSEILQQASASPFYPRTGPLPDVPVPEYYTLCLWPDCGSHSDGSSVPISGRPTCVPDESQASWPSTGQGPAPVSVLQIGQGPCDPGVPTRSLAWLDDQLWRAGVIEELCSLQDSSADCVDDCRLAVVGGESDAILGFVELDDSGGFPGEVIRLDPRGQEVGRWRLRGDLTWKQVAP